MPRSLLRPQVGTILWYYTGGQQVSPYAAIVTQTIDKDHFNLMVWDGAGAPSAQANVFYYNRNTVGVTPPVWASGTPWCETPLTSERFNGALPLEIGIEPPPGIVQGRGAPLPAAQPVAQAAHAGNGDDEEEDEEPKPPKEEPPPRPPPPRPTRTPHRPPNR